MDKTFTKAPDARLDYTRDWTAWLAGDSIVGSTWTTNAPGLSIDASSFTTSAATVWLLGGELGKSYQLLNHIQTAAGREDSRTFKIMVKAR